MTQIDLSERNIKDQFINLQNSVVSNLTVKQRKDFQERIQLISSIIKKIEYIKTWKDIAEKNDSVNKILKWIERYFPQKYKRIKERCNQLDEFDDFNEKFFYVNNQYATLCEVLDSKQNTQLMKLLISLKERLNDSDFASLKENIDKKFIDIGDKISFLGNLDKKLRKNRN